MSGHTVFLKSTFLGPGYSYVKYPCLSHSFFCLIRYIFAVIGPKRNPPSDLRAGGGVKKPRFLYTEEAMALAIQAVREGQCKTRQAAREFPVPFSTLQAR